MDPYNARKDATEKMLLEEFEAQLHYSCICDSESDRSDNAYMSSEHPDQQNETTCPHMKLTLMERT